MSEQIITNPEMVRVWITLASYIVLPIIIIHMFIRLKWVQKVGTVIMAYALGILMALTGLVAFTPDSMEELQFNTVQNMMMNIAVPLAIPLMLFNCDFKLWTKALPKTIWSLVGGIIAILVAVVSGYYLFHSRQIPDFAKVSAMMTGIYTGGTMNFNALGAALGVDKSVMAIVLAFEMVLTMPYILFILGGGYKLFRRILPYKDETTNEVRRNTKGQQSIEAPVSDVEDYGHMFRKDNWYLTLAGLGLSILFLAIGAGLSILLWKMGIVAGNPENPDKPVLNELVIILTITTLGLIASFFKKVRELPKTFELGMFFILVFSIIVASLFDYHSIEGSTLGIGAFVLWIILCGGIIHLLLCRLFHVGGDLFTVSQVALLCSPPFVPPVVGAMGNKKVLISGLVIGLIGYAVGTYLGIGIYYLLQ
ncbi:MAG: DUF819 family protein [Paludibacteraceae bacterium]|nr:DUF819 family protein [Paludibacteraceae bacterium]